MADQKVSDLPSLNGADVDAADLLYIIDSSAGSAGSKKITVGQYQLAPVSGGTANGVMYLNGSKVVTTGSDLVFDGTNLGIGTSSPAQKLQVNNSTAVNTYAAFSNPNATNGLYVGSAASGNGIVGTVDIQPLLFLTSAAERMRLDTSGNLGLGATPSAWVGDKALQVNWGSISSGYEYSVNVSSVAYRDNTTWKYLVSSQAPARYEQISGTHAWYTAPSGTAGNAISFTQAMTLDASGNLSVGTTAGGTRLQVFTATDNVEYFRAGTSAESRGIRFSSFIVSGTNGVGHLIDAPGASGVNGTLAFATNSTECARITSGGDLLVGTTTSAARLTVEGSALVAKFGRTSSGGIAQFQNGSDAGFGIDLLNVAGTSAGSIYWTATTTTYATSSDRRLKENVVAAPSASAAIDAIQIVSYDWKAAPNEPHTTYGVIAQDLHTVAPEAVSVGDDGDTVEKPWGVDYSKLVPMLIKEIQSLRARVAALESA